MRYLFVTGLPRSGTTIAARLLNLHPRCLVTLEAHLILDLMQMFQPNCGVEETPQVPTVWKGDDETAYNWHAHRLCRSLEGTEPWLRLVRAAHSGIVEGCFSEYEVFGGKSPYYSIEWPKVRRVLPDARFIIMERPLEECVASLLRTPWWIWSEADAEAMLQRHADGLVVLRRSGTPWLAVPLTGLKERPEEAVDAMLGFAGLDPDSYPMDEALALVNGDPLN